ncbi:Ras and EF-hand domain-containing protein [Paragonimus westermani]|uniref:Ras and EF-hand domain-containing protein n=1 Tax=Paragonimus westermani TaxID=34504 RepID=A0A5J4P0J1_9TREM|nr:Ras and EF-hand domain-containing protein [Paragonimus westermani]
MKEEDISWEVVQQATDLFFSCGPLEDKQNGTLYLPISDLSKGRITDSNVLANINVKDLETTFRLLDVNGDERLTLEEFIDGFGQFLTDAQCTQTAKVIQKRRSLEEKAKNQEIIEEATRARQNSVVSLEILQELLSSTFYNTIQSVLPKTAVEFDALINQASKEIDEIQKSMQQLQYKLENHTENYHRSLEQAYSELDEKLAQEEETHKLRTEQRSKQVNMEGQRNLAEKLEQLTEWQQKIGEVKVKMQDIQAEKDQNEKDIACIRLENDELLESIDEIEQALDESKQTVEQLQTAAKLEHIKREKVDVSTCEQIQIECEELMQKLDCLRELNRQLRDERDEALHEHRTLEGMNRGSLLDEVNEVFGREEALLKGSAGKGAVTCQGSTTENCTTKTRETGTSILFSDDTDCEYDQPWINSIKTGILSSNGHQVERMAFHELRIHKQQIYETLEDDVL